MERGFHADDALRLCQGLFKVPRHIVVPRDVRVHQRIERVEFNNSATRRERL